MWEKSLLETTARWSPMKPGIVESNHCLGSFPSASFSTGNSSQPRFNGCPFVERYTVASFSPFISVPMSRVAPGQVIQTGPSRVATGKSSTCASLKAARPANPPPALRAKPNTVQMGQSGARNGLRCLAGPAVLGRRSRDTYLWPWRHTPGRRPPNWSRESSAPAGRDPGRSIDSRGRADRRQCRRESDRLPSP